MAVVTSALAGGDLPGSKALVYQLVIVQVHYRKGGADTDLALQIKRTAVRHPAIPPAERIKHLPRDTKVVSTADRKAG